MSLQYKFFMIPAKDAAAMENDLNRFLRSVRVIQSCREFVSQGEGSFWCMAIEYLSENSALNPAKNERTGKIKIDYKEILSAEDFALFAKLRDWRKQTAETEAVPVYTIFTNEQLAKIAEKRITSKNKLHEIEGVGDARVKKYGEGVIKIVTETKLLHGQELENET